jgi:hypothetical protein
VSLANVLYPAPTPQGLEEWMHSHYQHHLAIIDAVRTNFNTELQVFPIYPVNMEDTSTFMRDHQIMHNQFASVLNTPNTDIGSVDFKNKKEFDAWVFEHFIQHQAAAQLCGMPI